MKRIKIGIVVLIAIVAVSLVGIGVGANSSSKNARGDYASSRIIVRFKGDVKPFRLIKVSKGKEIEKIKEYQAKANVIYAEPDYKVFALSTTTDTAYSNQWALNNTGQTIYHGSGSSTDPVDTTKPIGSGTPGADINWEKAWNNFASNTLATTTIAIVDSGIDETHPDLSAKIWQNVTETGNNGVDDDSNGYIDDTWGWDFVDNDNIPHDVYGHGTHVSGIAAARTNNGIGIAGVAFPDNVKIMPVRVLDENGIGYVSNVAKGIYYAADNGAKVINLSLGGRDSNTLKKAVDYAWDKGVLLAAAAGNDGGGRKYYPASYNDVISVAATDYNDNTASLSNFNNQVEVAAPGVNVFSTFPSYPFTLQSKYGRSEYYDVGSGTSMSVPHVVGLAALLFAGHPDYTNSEVRDIIDKSADDLGAVGRDNHYGYGRINLYSALTYSGETSPPSSECLKNGRYCNCNGKCDKFETTISCSWDCQ